MLLSKYMPLQKLKLNSGTTGTTLIPDYHSWMILQDVVLAECCYYTAIYNKPPYHTRWHECRPETSKLDK